jgi:hypothetical protein
MPAPAAGGTISQVAVVMEDLDDVEHRLAEARQGRFGIEMLMFHGTLPRPEYPAALRESTSRRWSAMAQQTLAYIR